MKYWINPANGNPYGQANLPIEDENVGGRDVKWLNTPKVK